MGYGMSDPRKLVIDNVTLSDAGTYACRVTNKFGNVSSSAILTVVQPTVTSGQLVMLVFCSSSLHYFASGLHCLCVLSYSDLYQ